MTYLPIQGYEESYEINEFGQVRSKERKVVAKDGTIYPKPAIHLKAAPHKDTAYFMVTLWKNNKGTSFYVHRLVGETFLPNPCNKKEINHIDGNRQNNHVSNLEWCTRTENSVHAVKTGLKIYTNRLSKAEFVECLMSVIAGESYASLSSRVPYKVPFLSVKLKRIAEELGLLGELQESLMIQRVQRARINGAKNSK